ncbi:MAG: response regulator [Gemmatimonadota bacterium]|nr:response regulator [Gemmatimonadota bacterium]
MKAPVILMVAPPGANLLQGTVPLEAAGCRVLSAHTAWSALETAAEVAPDAVLVELDVSEIDGFALGRSLKENPATADIPVIAVTTRSGKVLAGALEAGVDAYIAAPSDHTSFWAEVSSILQFATREHDSGAEPVPEGGHPIPDWRMSRGKVLVVEDEATNLRIMEFILGQDGHEVITAITGEEGLEMAREHNPDAIVLDVLLPGELDGYDVCRAIKEGPEPLRSTPVLMVSVLLDPRNRLEAIRAGANDFLSKPLEARELAMRVRNYVYAKRLQDRVLSDYQRLTVLEQLRAGLTQMLVHDLRTPIIGIRGYLDLLTLDYAETLPEEGQQFLSRAIHNTVTLQTLVNTVMDVSRLEEGSLPVNRSPVSLGEVVAEARRILGDDGDTLVSISADMLANCDQDLVLRVMVNLLSNALTFSPEGGVEVAAEVGSEGVRVEVRDRGEGVPDAEKERIFEKFVQGKSHGHRSTSSGLGLAFVRLAVEAHGGTVGVLDREGGGSIFWFEIPAA